MGKPSISYTLGMVLLGQTLVLGVLVQYLQFNNIDGVAVTIANIVSVISSLIIMVAVKHLLNDDYKNDLIEKQYKTLRSIDAIIKSARGQRHDFLNHIQAIYGLIQTNHIKEAKLYTQKLWKDAKEINELINLKWPETSALLHQKTNQAAAQQTIIELDIQTDLAFCRMSPYHLNIVLGNLIDNALEAVKSLDSKERSISLEMTEDGQAYTIRVSNTGSALKKEEIEKIFEPVYSTKGVGRGLGLCSVVDSLKKFGGHIEVQSDPVTFIVYIPISESRR